MYNVSGLSAAVLLTPIVELACANYCNYKVMQCCFSFSAPFTSSFFLLGSVALSLGLPIGVTQERLERLALIGLRDVFTDDLDGVRIRVVQNKGLNDRV